MNKIKELEAALASIPANTAQAISIIDENPAILRESIGGDDISYSLNDMASLIVFYACDDVLKHVVEKHTEEIQNSLLMENILANKETEALNIVFNSPSFSALNLDLSIINNSFLTTAIKYGWDKEYIQKFMDAGSSPVLTNTFSENAFVACAEKGDVNIFNILNRNNAIKDPSLNVDNILHAAVRHNNAPVFDEVLPFTKTSLDVFFHHAISLKQTQILTTIVYEDRFLPGADQLNDLIKVVTYNYAEEEDYNASICLMDFLCTVKVPFQKFIDKDSNNVWNLALDNQNQSFIERLLSMPELLNIQDAKGRTPIMYSLLKRNHVQAEMLLQYKPKLNIEDNLGDTPLIACCRHNMPTLVEGLIDGGANVYHRNGKDETAMYWACHYKNFGTVARLLWAGAPISDNTKELTKNLKTGSVSPNGSFEAFDKSENVQLNNFAALVDMGFNLNALNEKGETFPMHFLKNNQIHNFSSICECHFNPNQVSPDDGSTLLIEAVKKTNPRFLNLLFNKFSGKIDAGAIDNNNMDALDYAIGYRNPNAIYKILTEANNVNRTKVAEAFPILLSSSNYKMESLLKLADFYEVQLQDVITEKNEDMWLVAVNRGDKEDVEFLFEEFEEGPNYDLVNSSGQNFLDLLKHKDINFVSSFKELLSQKKVKP